jgi:hypothetical protein
MSIVLLLDVIALFFMIMAAFTQLSNKVVGINFMALSFVVWMLARLITA